MKNEHVKTNDLRDVFSLLLRRKWFIILPWVLVSAFVLIGVRFLTPEYESWTIVQTSSQSSLGPELQQLLGIRRTFNREGRMDRLKAIYNQLTSSAYVAKLAERLHLFDDPDLTARARKVVANNPNMTLDNARLSLLQNDLAMRINVGFAAQDQVRISVTSPEPVKARDIANALAAIYLEEKYQTELSSVRSSQDFSDIQLRKYESDLEKKIQEKTELEKEFLKVKLDESIVSETNRSDIITEIDRTKTQLEDLYAQERSLLKRLKKNPGLSVNRLKLKESQELKDAKSQLKRGVASIGDLVIKYTWSDPQNLNFRVRQSSLLDRVESETARLVNAQYADRDKAVRADLADLFSVRAQLDYNQQKVTALQAALDDLNRSVDIMPEYQAKLDRLTREINSLIQLRDKFKKQQETSSISQALLQDVSTNKYSVIEPAKLPLVPVKPDKFKIILVGIGLGLVLGLAVVAILELLDNSFRKVEEVEEYLDLPVVGVVGRIDVLKKVAQ